MEMQQVVTEKYAQITAFFEEKIVKYIIGDLNVLDSIQEPNYNNTCAIPHAMLIFSSMDLIGHLLKETGKLDASRDNIKECINHFPEEYKDKADTFVINYRHGMMHSFFPKNCEGGFYTIHKIADDSDNLFINNILNVNKLSKDFREFITRISDLVKEGSNEALMNNISNSFKNSIPNESVIQINSMSPATGSCAVLTNKR